MSEQSGLALSRMRIAHMVPTCGHFGCMAPSRLRLDLQALLVDVMGKCALQARVIDKALTLQFLELQISRPNRLKSELTLSEIRRKRMDRYLKIFLLAAFLACQCSAGHLATQANDFRRDSKLHENAEERLKQDYDAGPNPPTIDWRYIEYGTTMLQAAYLDQPYCVVHDRSQEEQRWVCVVTSDTAREGGPGEDLVRWEESSKSFAQHTLPHTSTQSFMYMPTTALTHTHITYMGAHTYTQAHIHTHQRIYTHGHTSTGNSSTTLAAKTKTMVTTMMVVITATTAIGTITKENLHHHQHPNNKHLSKVG